MGNMQKTVSHSDRKIGKAYRSTKATKLKKKERGLLKSVKRKYVNNREPKLYPDKAGR